MDPATLNQLYAELLRDGARLDGKPGGLSPRTVRYVATIVGAAFRDAVKWGRLVRNPASLAEPPAETQARGPEMRTWDADTLRRFLEAEAHTRYGPAFLFLATTGCRRGEALGLRWSDVDLNAGTTSLRFTVTAINHRIHEAPRTKGGRPRVITLDAPTTVTLRAWRKAQAAERLLMGAGYAAGDFVFCLPERVAGLIFGRS